MLLKQAQLLGSSRRKRYNSIVVFRVTVFQASQTSSLVLRCNSVNVMALLGIETVHRQDNSPTRILKTIHQQN